jgi:hypothetical protein
MSYHRCIHVANAILFQVLIAIFLQPADAVAKWNAALASGDKAATALQPKLALPQPNEFIASDFELRHPSLKSKRSEEGARSTLPDAVAAPAAGTVTEPPTPISAALTAKAEHDSAPAGNGSSGYKKREPVPVPLRVIFPLMKQFR